MKNTRWVAIIVIVTVALAIAVAMTTEHVVSAQGQSHTKTRQSPGQARLRRWCMATAPPVIIPAARARSACSPIRTRGGGGRRWRP